MSSSTRSRGLRLPSWVSFWCGSGSSGSSCRRSWLWWSSCWADVGHQEGHSSLELIDVIGQMHSESHLPEALSEGHKNRGFRASLDVEEQASSSYRFPVGDASADILADIDDRISSNT